jgi:hypothetical protein
MEGRMLLSELIAKLQKIQEDNGDLPVCDRDEGFYYVIDDVEILDGNSWNGPHGIDRYVSFEYKGGA